MVFLIQGCECRLHVLSASEFGIKAYLCKLLYIFMLQFLVDLSLSIQLHPSTKSWQGHQFSHALSSTAEYIKYLFKQNKTFLFS